MPDVSGVAEPGTVSASKSKVSVYCPEAFSYGAPTGHLPLSLAGCDDAGRRSLVWMQDKHVITADPENFKVVTSKKPTELEFEALLFGWKLIKYVKSNAVIFCSRDRTLGIGAGQPSRVDATELAIFKAKKANLQLTGSVVVSDAFFPFRDGIDVAHEAGATAVIQPGGSIRDEEVIAAADEHNMSMVFTGIRHFRHY